MLFQYGGYSSTSLFQTLVDYGLLDALLPFLLIFIIVFAVLQRLALFGTPGTGPNEPRVPDRRINLVLSIVVALMIVVPHVVGLYPFDSDPIILINTFLPHTAVLLIAILCVILLLGLAGGEVPSLFLWVIALVAVAILVFVILMATIPGFFPWFDFLRRPDWQAGLIIVLTAALVVYFFSRGDDDQTDFGGWVTGWLGRPQ